MKLIDRLTDTGSFLFRWRSYVPLLLLPVFVASFSGRRYAVDSAAVRLAWEAVCFLVAMAGLAIRVFTVGTAARGTSGRNTRAQKAEVLNTTGLYSILRHPLYVGNALIALGVSGLSRTWFLPVIVALAALVYYERIAACEERYLEAKFGDEFRRWADRVPAMIPAFSKYRAPALRFSWRVALGREFYALCLITTLFSVIRVVDRYSVTGYLALDAESTVLFLVGVAVFAILRVLKKRGRLRPTAPGTTRGAGLPVS
jgi:protein-S-isoprenylcysteine O-methyltransferase Ste14